MRCGACGGWPKILASPGPFNPSVKRRNCPITSPERWVQPLVKAGLLESLRGPGGGFVFTNPPKDISLSGASWKRSKEGPILLQNEATETAEQGARYLVGRRYLPRC